MDMNDANINYVIDLILSFTSKYPRHTTFELSCNPDLSFDENRVIEHLKSLEGWTNEIHLNYRSYQMRRCPSG